MKGQIRILGGGPAGLAVGYFSRQQGLPFTIYEARDRIGGNAVTFAHREFLFDSGAHRFHDQDAEITAQVKQLLGEDLVRVDVPSQIYADSKCLDFPLSPLNLLAKLGPFTFCKAAVEVLVKRVKNSGPVHNFEDFALRTYGETIAHCFLLNYSEKLWGTPCKDLSLQIAGRRMKGLNLKTFIKETLLGKKSKTEHLDGAFYYPRRGGFGQIVERLADYCRRDRLRLQSEVTGVRHHRRRIRAIEVNGGQMVDTADDEVVSTLPLDQLLSRMTPPPPGEILSLAKSLRFRHVLLVCLCLNRPSVTGAATVYFPETAFPFTRMYEPRNRSQGMAPPERTLLVVEIPCHGQDNCWQAEEGRLISRVRDSLTAAGWIRDSEILDATVRRMSHAYPLLERGIEKKVEPIMRYLEGFENLKVSGRNATFSYIHVHDVLRDAKEIVAGYSQCC
jgi:protoporphyrinogen oxidase